MCGIAGIVNEKGNNTLERVHRMVAALASRGPDDEGTWVANDGIVALGHRRLSIIDLSSFAHQPMSDETCSIGLTYNGEIYNFQELRDDLMKQGVAFRSRSDTEVVLRLYQKEGVDSLVKLRGMFALAIWDSAGKTLFLARDRFGMKPLYYYHAPGVFVFASEVKALMQSGLVPADLDEESLAMYLKYGSVPAPKTIYQHIFSLEPAHYLVVSKNRIEKKRYWDLSECFSREKSGLTAEEAVARLQERLEDSVRRHLIADVPVGIFLSGGVDSSALVSLVRKVSQNNIKTISANLPYSEFDERPYAQQVAQAFHTEHIEVDVQINELASQVDDFFGAMDQPTVDGLNTYVVSKVAKNAGLKVCLSGLGGDELFGGYWSFRHVPRIYQMLRWLDCFKMGQPSLRLAGLFSRSNKTQRLLEMFTPQLSLKNVYLNCRSVFSHTEVSQILGKAVSVDFGSVIPADGEKIPTMAEKISFYEMTSYMANQLLRDSDVFGMSHSLEIRVPFVDHLLLEFVAGVPNTDKYDNVYNKNFLIKAVGDLPPEIYQRKKKGFALPMERWIRAELNGPIEEMIMTAGVFDQNVAQKFIKGFHAKTVHWSRIWSLYVLCRWLRRNMGEGAI